MEKEKIFIILLLIAIIVSFFYFLPKVPNVTTTTTTTLPLLSDEIKKQDLQKLNLTYIGSLNFSIAKFLDFSQMNIDNKTFIKNSTAIATCIKNNCSIGGFSFEEFFSLNSSFLGVRSTKFGLCKLFYIQGKNQILNVKGNGSTCILENGFPYNYTLGNFSFVLKKTNNFSNPIGFVVIHFYSYYNQSTNKTFGTIEIYPFHELKNATYKLLLPTKTIEEKINAKKAQPTQINFSINGYFNKLNITINNVTYSLSPEFYYSSSCPSYCIFGCIPGTSTCYYPQKIQLKNGNFSKGFSNWITQGTGFMVCNSSCPSPFGGSWSGYSAINFATTCAGKTTSFGNLSSDFFVAYLPFLSFQVVSYSSEGLYFLIIAKNGSVLDKYEIDTTPISKNVTTFANVSIPIAPYIFKEIAIKVVQTQSGFIDYVKCVAVGNFYQTFGSFTTTGVEIKKII
ncbi:MAG: hypothetical protein ACP5HJ_01985 [Candidatus Micrarchaeia archaeon]